MTRKGLQLRLPPDVKTWVEHEAKRNGSSQNSEIVRALRAAMEKSSTAPASQTCEIGALEKTALGLLMTNAQDARARADCAADILKQQIAARFESEMSARGIQKGSLVTVQFDLRAVRNRVETFMGRLVDWRPAVFIRYRREIQWSINVEIQGTEFLRPKKAGQPTPGELPDCREEFKIYVVHLFGKTPEDVARKIEATR